MSRRITVLSREQPEALADIHPEDAKLLGVTNAEPLRVVSRRGEIVVKTRLTDEVPRKTVFIPFHFAEAAANVLTHGHCDAEAGIPEYKVCAVNLERL